MPMWELVKGSHHCQLLLFVCYLRDNTHLRHEIGVLKDKHVRQQKVLNKVSVLVVIIILLKSFLQLR